jgi:hypothetical protein
MALPIRRIMIYKHGVGYFERRGAVSGETLRLSFPRAAMDDVLKSLVALDLGAGQVLSIDYETPEDRAALLAKGSIHLSDNHSMLDLLRDLRGRRVRLFTSEKEKPAPKAKPGFGLGGNGPKGEEEGEEEPEGQISGLVVGVEYEDEDALLRATVAIYQPERRQVRSLALSAIRRLELLDDAAGADLDYFLRAAQSEEERRSATLHLSPGEHDLLVGYIAPAPAWRVSYRMLFEEDEGPKTKDESPAGASTSVNAQPSSTVLLQGWGLFDNQLEEDLEGVELSLVAGMPVSFRYRLYEPKTPERPLVEDEERTVDAPVFFAAAPPPAMAEPMAADMAFGGAPRAMAAAAPTRRAKFEAAAMEESVQVSAGGEERGALFAYAVQHPVSVARGQSAMVPIVSAKLAGRRELLYNGRKLAAHPVASLRLSNSSGLTLERGPVTVLENGDYAGEAVVSFTRAGAELIVPYAVELGVTVVEQSSSERITASVRVQNDYLLIDTFVIARREYQLTSTLDKPCEVVIEHVPLHGHELYETPAPSERGAEFLRWAVACPANRLTSFTVRERQRTSRREQLRGQNSATLQRFLADKFLDQATFAALEQVLGIYRQIEQQNQALAKIAKQREAIYQQQRQIQGNLGPLGREGEEGTLRGRYVAELNTLEDQLKALSAEEQRIGAQIAELEALAAAKLKALSN